MGQPGPLVGPSPLSTCSYVPCTAFFLPFLGVLLRGSPPPPTINTTLEHDFLLCWGMWASRSKWPNPHILLQHQTPLITPGGAHAMRGNGHTLHTLWTRGGWAGGCGGHIMRSSQGGLSARKGRLKLVMCPR